MKQSETLHHPTPEFSQRFHIKVDPESHGFDGPLKTSYPRYTWDLHHPFVEVLKTLGNFGTFSFFSSLRPTLVVGIPNNPDPVRSTLCKLLAFGIS